ncbi:FHA domain-containing protein FhaB/FipA [Microterricola pindariensis]|uniref:FHA domain-containing protein n=1 Tax=Microterricola pindariensis TaxID=478010 RepID=A0ABX5AZN1_9MICO|nr:FHA domain-containing protein [Microterricola pindariensis]PPL19789.1 FHA domain-containing protein [Microterricola pindariensis]
MTSELTLLVLRLGFLLLLWLFVFAIVYALRSDLFGQRVRKLQPTDAVATAPPAGNGHSSPPKPSAAAPVFASPAPAGPVSASAAAVAEPVLTPAFGRDVASAQTAHRLVITSGAKAGAEFPLGRDEITIGRSSDSAIVIRDDYTSTHHARLMLWNDQWMLQDLDSTNGTFLDGARVTVPTPVPLNATVKIGSTTFELRR